MIVELVRELVTGGMEDEDTYLLSSALVIARQTSLEGPHISPSYQSWLQVLTVLLIFRLYFSYQATFGDSRTSVIAGKKQLLFLLKTLTSFVPYDPVFALKVNNICMSCPL